MWSHGTLYFWRLQENREFDSREQGSLDRPVYADTCLTTASLKTKKDQLCSICLFQQCNNWEVKCFQYLLSLFLV